MQIKGSVHDVLEERCKEGGNINQDSVRRGVCAEEQICGEQVTGS